jgi:hypothetical protein
VGKVVSSNMIVDSLQGRRQDRQKKVILLIKAAIMFRSGQRLQLTLNSKNNEISANLTPL